MTPATPERVLTTLSEEITPEGNTRRHVKNARGWDWWIVTPPEPLLSQRLRSLYDDLLAMVAP